MGGTTSVDQMHLSTAKNRTATVEKTTAEKTVKASWSRADGSHMGKDHSLLTISGFDAMTSDDNHK